MESWCEGVEKGIELMRQEWHPRTEPWQGASNYKDPILTEASVKFGDKAKLELLRSSDLVTYGIKGKDFDGSRAAAGERVAEAMNYQISCEMPTWRKDQEKVLYSLPNYGSVFKKMVYDPVDQKTESVRICYPDFVVNQATESIDKARSFSHVMDFSRNECIERINAELWLDFLEKDSDDNGDKGSNESEDVTHAMENPDKFIEQQCFYDLDGDGYEEPYIVTIRHKNCEVVRIQARYDEKSIFVDMDGKATTLAEALEAREQAIIESFGGEELIDLMGVDIPEDDMDMTVVRIEPFQNIVHYGFIPAPDGTFLCLGYAHLLGAMCQQINTNTNQLTDAATLENLSGGFLSKEFRKTTGLQRLAPGQWLKTDVTAEKMRNGIFPKPAQPPSQTLYNLLKDRTERAQSYLAVLDISGQLTAQTAPTTALAMIQEASIPTNAILSRVLDSESEEFQILYRINQSTFPEDKYKLITGDQNADPAVDFSDDLYIIPTANAELSSKSQRLQSAIAGMELFDRVLQSGGNPVPLVKRYYEAIDPALVDEIYPEEGIMSPEEKAQLQRMTEAQEIQNQIQQLQLQILEREQQRLDAETASNLRTAQKELEKMTAEIVEIYAKAYKYSEEGDSEAVKNQIDGFNARVEALSKLITVQPMEQLMQ
jgi:chaperonin GroES